MSYTCLQYHIIFATKERRRWIDDQLVPRMVKYIGGIIRDLGGSMVEANGFEDHLHIAASLTAAKSVAECLREIKAGSSAWVHRDFPDMGEFGWQEGYSAFAVSQSIMPKVVEYIRGQKQHHAKMSFTDELALLLERHGIQYDRRYL